MDSHDNDDNDDDDDIHTIDNTLMGYNVLVHIVLRLLVNLVNIIVRDQWQHNLVRGNSLKAIAMSLLRDVVIVWG